MRGFASVALFGLILGGSICVAFADDPYPTAKCEFLTELKGRPISKQVVVQNIARQFVPSLTLYEFIHFYKSRVSLWFYSREQFLGGCPARS